MLKASSWQLVVVVGSEHQDNRSIEQGLSVKLQRVQASGIPGRTLRLSTDVTVKSQSHFLTRLKEIKPRMNRLREYEEDTAEVTAQDSGLRVLGSQFAVAA